MDRQNFYTLLTHKYLTENKSNKKKHKKCTKKWNIKYERGQKEYQTEEYTHTHKNNEKKRRKAVKFKNLLFLLPLHCTLCFNPFSS